MPSRKPALAFVCFLGLVVVALVVWTLRPASRQDTTQSASSPLWEKSATDESSSVPDFTETAERSRERLPASAEAEVAEPAETTSDVLARLLARLRALDHEMPGMPFYDPAVHVLFEIAAVVRDRDEEAEPILGAHLADRDEPSRVRAGLILAIGLGLDRRHERELCRRTTEPVGDAILRWAAVAGLSRAREQPPDVLYRTDDYWTKIRYQSVEMFPLALARLDAAEDGLADAVLQALQAVVRNGDSLQLKELAVLVLGQWIDSNAAARELVFATLGDADGLDHSLWRVCLFVLSFSERNEVLEPLLGMVDPLPNQRVSKIAREEILIALARRCGSERALQVVLEAAGDSKVFYGARALIVLGLSEQLIGSLSGDSPRRRAILDRLGQIALTDATKGVRSASVLALARAPSAESLEILAAVLRSDEEPMVRQDAARAAIEAAPDRKSAARVLEQSFLTEREPETRAVLLTRLGRLLDPETAHVFRAALEEDPDGPLGKIAEEILVQLKPK